MTTPGLLLACVVALPCVSAAAIALRGLRATTSLVYGACLLLSLCVLAAALTHLLTQSPALDLVTPLGPPGVQARFRLDALSAVFLVIVGLAGAAASLFGVGYGAHEIAPHRVLPFYPAFLAGMTLTPLADDAFSFLFGWEFMSLASWALVVAHHHEASNRRAGFVYLVMAGFGAFALLLAFALLGANGLHFAAMRAHAPTAGVATLAFILAILGAGSKAGLAPLHVWLPLAHPAAPSHVSALMSGAMTKVAIYGFVRIAFDLAGPPPWWAGLVLLVLGSLTAALGILHALMESNLKRVLAYSTIENIGVIFVSLGLAMAFAANAMPAPAALAFTAALFHALNHALFKSLLFFGAGATLTATGARDLDAMGGLIHRMPRTAVVFLIGCISISALPPFNGFVSEWLSFQAILQSPALPQWGLKIITPAVGALLALAAALAAACFVRVYGVAFLGRPRTDAAAQAHEVDAFSLTAMGALAALCLFAGVLPGSIIDAIAPASQAIIGAPMPRQAHMPWLSIIPIAESRSSYNGLLVFVFILMSGSLAAAVIHRLGSRALRRGPAWGCGFPPVGPISQYSAGSFAQPIRRVFGSVVFAARERVDMPAPGDPRAARIALSQRDIIWDMLFAPLARSVTTISTWLNRFQFLTIRLYLGLVFLLLVTLLLALALWT